ncbi:MAG: hypothetical protein KY429_01540 [Actinobacteria bacterium]|nr:hypothetical protein [Actinomycetota bacterium]
MPTISDAQSELENLARSGANEVQVRDWTNEIEAARATAQVKASEFVGARYEEFASAHAEVLRDATQIRDELESLAIAGEKGDASLVEFRSQYDDLQRELRQTERRIEDLERVLEKVESIESDPVGWMDDLYRRYPSIGPQFSFLER